MSNRMAVLHILREHFKDWQIILMTHDRVWYETVRMSTRGEETWWHAELFAQPGHDGVTELNAADESPRIEAKRSREVGKSIIEGRE
ncbi:MAG: hypothetical protein HZB71_09295 [Betaproteobacteria bacterium]|nr:hypothetical protein [Betaproteobacteria bacterium]